MAILPHIYLQILQPERQAGLDLCVNRKMPAKHFFYCGVDLTHSYLHIYIKRGYIIMKDSVANQPISKPIIGRETDMEQNAAGGYGFMLHAHTRVLRFLILGAVGTLYATRQATAIENSLIVINMAKDDGETLVSMIEHVVTNNLAPSKSPAIFALAVAKVFGDENTRKAVYRVIANRNVLRTAGQLQDFMLDVNILAGGDLPNGAGMRRALKTWMRHESPRWLAEQFLKYRARSKSVGNGKSVSITPTDLLRLARPSGRDMGADFEQIFSWVTKGKLLNNNEDELSQYLSAFSEMQTTTDYRRIMELIELHRFTWESVPNSWFSDKNQLERKCIWIALLKNMPPVAMIRNVTRMARYGVFDNLHSRSLLIKRLVDADFVKNSGLHPVQIFNTYRVYSAGMSSRNIDNTWNVEPAIVDALEKAYYHSYATVVPTHKRIAFFMDLSGSMSAATIASMEKMPAMHYAAVLALTLMKTESDYMIKGFGTDIEDLSFHGGMSIGDVLQYVSKIDYHWGTDVGMTIISLLQSRSVFDAVVIITDNESWQGNNVSPLWKKYLSDVNPSAKLVYVAMEANKASMDDPFEMSSIELVGANADTPFCINSFIKC